MDILQLPALKSILPGEYAAAELLSSVNSTIAPSLLSLLCRAQLNCPLGTPELDCRFSTELSIMTTLHGPNRKLRSQQCLHCCFRIRCHGNLFTKPLPSNGRLLRLHYSGLQASCHYIYGIFYNNNVKYTRTTSFQPTIWCGV
jgi:hypothetical protein